MVGGLGSGLAGLHMQSMLLGESLITSGDWLALGRAVPPDVKAPEIWEIKSHNERRECTEDGGLGAQSREEGSRSIWGDLGRPPALSRAGGKEQQISDVRQYPEPMTSPRLSVCSRVPTAQ